MLTFFPKVGELICSKSDCKCNGPLYIRGVDYIQQKAIHFQEKTSPKIVLSYRFLWCHKAGVSLSQLSRLG